MTTNEKFSRRNFIGKYLGGATTLLCGGWIVSGCDKNKSAEKNTTHTKADASVDPCDDLSGLSENDIALRQKLAYVKKSPVAESRCNNCNLYLPPGEGKDCGLCMLFKGPVYQEGYCTYWAPQVEGS